ncbi:MAG TPA: metallopeptidase family protein [Steroidobacteraceae bacterium]|nr:metallopeptidase family protein [Dehalococcoidia bacterium]HYM27015.1 metallopeptidase family protein [Steroidobacteraceae bacterium]
MYEADDATFEQMMVDAIDRLPERFRDRIANVEFAIEDEAQPEDYGRTRTPRGAVLLGIYRGVPLTRRGAGYNFALPDRIVIFRRALQQIARDDADLRERVAHVVQHEVAHYFGISDDRLREIEAY